MFRGIPHCNFRRCARSCKLHSQEQILLLWPDASHEGDTPKQRFRMLLTIIQSRYVTSWSIAAALGPTGHWGNSALGIFATLWKSSWQLWDKQKVFKLKRQNGRRECTSGNICILHCRNVLFQSRRRLPRCSSIGTGRNKNLIKHLHWRF